MLPKGNKLVRIALVINEKTEITMKTDVVCKRYVTYRMLPYVTLADPAFFISGFWEACWWMDYPLQLLMIDFDACKLLLWIEYLRQWIYLVIYTGKYWTYSRFHDYIHLMTFNCWRFRISSQGRKILLLLELSIQNLKYSKYNNVPI